MARDRHDPIHQMASMRIELGSGELSNNSQPKLLDAVLAIGLSPAARADKIEEQTRVELEKPVPIIVAGPIELIASATLFDVVLKPIKKNSFQVILFLRLRERTRRNQC